MMNVNGLLACALIGAWLPTAAAGQAIRARDADQATVWYLRHAGWAVRLGDALLIFDYQESLGMEDVTVETPRNLASGFIDPREIADLDVFVFVTHAHGDHYDPVIFRWQGQIAHPTYVIGWEEEPASHCERFVRDQTACHTMRGPRATAELDDLRVYTINSHHDDVPDVAYLVRYGDWTVYHNGDYMAG